MEAPAAHRRPGDEQRPLHIAATTDHWTVSRPRGKGEEHCRGDFNKHTDEVELAGGPGQAGPDGGANGGTPWQSQLPQEIHGEAELVNPAREISRHSTWHPKQTGQTPPGTQMPVHTG